MLWADHHFGTRFGLNSSLVAVNGMPSLNIANVVLGATFLLSALRSLAALGSDCASDEYINPPYGQTLPSPTCILLTMLFTPLCSVIFVAQLLGAVLAVPSPLLDSVCSRLLTHSNSVAYPQLRPSKIVLWKPEHQL